MSNLGQGSDESELDESLEKTLRKKNATGTERGEEQRSLEVLHFFAGRDGGGHRAPFRYIRPSYNLTAVAGHAGRRAPLAPGPRIAYNGPQDKPHE